MHGFCTAAVREEEKNPAQNKQGDCGLLYCEAFAELAWLSLSDGSVWTWLLREFDDTDPTPPLPPRLLPHYNQYQRHVISSDLALSFATGLGGWTCTRHHNNTHWVTTDIYFIFMYWWVVTVYRKHISNPHGSTGTSPSLSLLSIRHNKSASCCETY